MDTQTKQAFFEFLLRVGDERLVLAQRLSEWCGHAPSLEEDIALANIALDLFGHAQATLNLAGEVEGQGRDADKLAYFREAIDFRNSWIVEQPRGDFAATIARLFCCAVLSYLQWEQLAKTSHETLRGIAQKAQKEARYHVTHSSEWLLRLGDGTPESHERMQAALNDVWKFTDDMFVSDNVEAQLVKAGIIPDLSGLKAQWTKMITDTVSAATLQMADTKTFMLTGGRIGKHSEHLGHLLSEMQILPRSYPDARW